MKVIQLEVGNLGTNCYIAYCENTKKAVIIDPGGGADRIMSAVKKEGLSVLAIINTHGHADRQRSDQFGVIQDHLRLHLGAGQGGLHAIFGLAKDARRL